MHSFLAGLQQLAARKWLFISEVLKSCLVTCALSQNTLFCQGRHMELNVNSPFLASTQMINAWFPTKLEGEPAHLSLDVIPKATLA